MLSDGHHKLIRWRFVTHGGIDGHSRLIVYLRCSTNNRAATVLTNFRHAVQLYGLPSRVRSDQGGENIDVALYMLRNRGDTHRSMITGQSIHNQRIERLWRDMHHCVTSLYYRLFYFMEQQEILDPLNNHHLFSLHFVYLPRINKALEIFREGWNHHQIRTAQHRTPHQIFVEGILCLHSGNLSALDILQPVDNYGIETDEILSVSSDGDVTIPETVVHLSAATINRVQQVNPLMSSDNYGIDIYERILDILMH